MGTHIREEPLDCPVCGAGGPALAITGHLRLRCQWCRTDFHDPAATFAHLLGDSDTVKLTAIDGYAFLSTLTHTES